MEVIRHSFIAHLLTLLFAWLDRTASRSMLAAWLGAVWAWLRRLYRHSLLRRLLARSSRMDALFAQSTFGRLFSALLLLPDRLLNGSFTGTVLQPFGTALTVPVLALSSVVILSLPYEKWNNFYALYFAVFAFLLLCLSKNRRMSLRSIGFWPLGFGILTLFSALWSQDVGESLRFLFFALTGMLFVLVCVNAIDSRRLLLLLSAGIAVGLLVCCGYGVYQKIIGIAPNAHYTDLSSNADMPGRVYSFFDNPNSFANIPVLFNPLMLAMFCYAPKLWHKLLFGAAFALSAYCLIMTFTRGAWLAWLIAVFVFILIMKPRLTLWLAGILFCCIPLLPDSILNRFLTIFSGDSSINSRTPIYQAILKLIVRHPIFGVGLGSTNLREVINQEGLYAGGAYFVHGHNLLFQICGESGLVTLLCFLPASYFPLRSGILAGAGKADLFTRAAAAGAVSGILGSLLFGLTDYIWSYPRIMLLYWLLFGILLAAAALCRNEVRPTCN